MSRATLIHGDCLEVLRDLADCSVDAVVTDPPAGIGFMGRAWDSDKGGRDHWIAWLASVMRECLRVLKPGGHALVWALPRTSHWTATAIEDAGFEIRDRHHHIGALDERAAEFIAALDPRQRDMLAKLVALQDSPIFCALFGSGFPKSLTPNSAAIPDGTGTALKPAVEHWILARKPLEGTVAENFAEHGTGVLGIEACRIGTSKEVPVSAASDRVSQIAKGDERGRTTDSPGFDPNVGRWPAHLSLDEVGAAAVDEQSGVSRSKAAMGVARKGRSGGIMGAVGPTRDGRPEGHNDTGGASRFFFIAKAPRSEKDAGLDDLPASTGGEATGRLDGSAGTRNPRAGAGRTGGAKNIHPTCKRVALMRWLVRLITPPGGLVLDPFAGSGTTGLACHAEGMHFLGIEREPSKPGQPDYHGIALRRLRKAFGRVETELPEQRALDALLTPRRPVAPRDNGETESVLATPQQGVL